MAANEVSQTTPIQITHVLVLCASTQIMACNFDSCKSLTFTWCVIINNTVIYWLIATATTTFSK